MKLIRKLIKIVEQSLSVIRLKGKREATTRDIKEIGQSNDLCKGSYTLIETIYTDATKNKFQSNYPI